MSIALLSIMHQGCLCDLNMKWWNTIGKVSFLICDAAVFLVLSKGELSPSTSQSLACSSPGLFRGWGLLGEYGQHNLWGQTGPLGCSGERSEAVPVSNNHTHTNQTFLCIQLSFFFSLCFQRGPDRDLWAHPWDSESGAAEQRAADAAAAVSQHKGMSVEFCCMYVFQIFSEGEELSWDYYRKQVQTVRYCNVHN